MDLQIEALEDWRIIRPLEKRLDAHVSQNLKQALTEHVSGETRRVILDLSQVEFMDSSGIGVLVFFKQYLGEGARVVLAAVHPGVVTILKLTHLDRVFDIFATTEEVLQEDLQAG